MQVQNRRPTPSGHQVAHAPVVSHMGMRDLELESGSDPQNMACNERSLRAEKNLVRSFPPGRIARYLV